MPCCRCLTPCRALGLAVVADNEGVAKRVGEIVALVNHLMLVGRCGVREFAERNMKVRLTFETVDLAQPLLAEKFLTLLGTLAHHSLVFAWVVDFELSKRMEPFSSQLSCSFLTGFGHRLASQRGVIAVLLTNLLRVLGLLLAYRAHVLLKRRKRCRVEEEMPNHVIMRRLEFLGKSLQNCSFSSPSRQYSITPFVGCGRIGICHLAGDVGLSGVLVLPKLIAAFYFVLLPPAMYCRNRFHTLQPPHKNSCRGDH